MAPIGEKTTSIFSPRACAIVQGIERLAMMKASKASIFSMFLGVGGLTAMSSAARAAEPEATPSAGAAAGRDPITVEQAPGVDVPPQLAIDLRAAVQDALAGRAQPAVPIEITVEAGGAVVRVGALSRRVAIEHWNYSTVRTVALHVLDLLQPAPEVPEGAPATPMAEPAAAAPTVVAAPSAERAPEFPGPWSVHAAVVGSHGAQGPDPWTVGGFIGAAWTRDWFRAGVEVGWDHSIVRHVDYAGVLTTVNYDAIPFRLVLAAQNSSVMAGVRGGVAPYRLTAQQNYWVVTPLVGPFLGFKIPIVSRVRGLLVAGFDYFARRTQLSGSGIETLYSSPELAPYLAAVVEVGLGP
jgi:hypothetical protein